MRKTLSALLVTLAVSGLFVLARIDDDATPAGLRDAGLQQCPPSDLACEVRVSDEWLDRLESRGVDAGKRYRRILVDARDCREFDAGVVVTDRRLYRDGRWLNGFDVIDGRCRLVGDAGIPDDGGTGLREQPLECGCRRASGACRYQLADGGLATPPFGVTLGPGYFLNVGGEQRSLATFGGAGCEKKSCIGFFATDGQGRPVDDTWPESCPGG